jgi:hypothetical protein
MGDAHPTRLSLQAGQENPAPSRNYGYINAPRNDDMGETGRNRSRGWSSGSARSRAGLISIIVSFTDRNRVTMPRKIFALGCVLVIATPVLNILVVPRSVKAPGESGHWVARTQDMPSREFVPAGGGGGQRSFWIHMILGLRKVAPIRAPDPPPGFPAPTVHGVGRNSCCYSTVPEHDRSPQPMRRRVGQYLRLVRLAGSSCPPESGVSLSRGSTAASGGEQGYSCNHMR